MKWHRRLWVTASVAAGLVSAQKIETRKADRARITRLETALNHLSVIELGEEVVQVAAGSNSYKVEWRENKVFVQPLEANARTNLFIWTKNGRLNYELIPANVETMHFAIDEEPAAPAKEPEIPRRAVPPVVESSSKIPAEMLLGSKPVRVMGTPGRSAKNVEVVLTDIYRSGGKLYLRYLLRNHGTFAYRAANPSVFRLAAARTSQSLVPVHDTQLIGAPVARLTSDAEVSVPVVHSEIASGDLPPGSVAAGLVAFEEPREAEGSKAVVKIEFPRRSADLVVAYLVL